MPTIPHFFVQCLNPSCRFRFPASGHKPLTCPHCHQNLLAFESIDPCPVEGLAPIPSSPFRGVLLDNIRSIFNVGSIFRTADGLALEHIYLCGISATPEHPRLAKTALGSQHSTGWSHHLNGVDLAHSLIEEGYQIWALEGGADAVSLFDLRSFPSSQKIILAVGNEITGIDPKILRLCSSVFFLPMQGLKGSLNVAVAFGIAAYHLRFSVLVS